MALAALPRMPWIPLQIALHGILVTALASSHPLNPQSPEYREGFLPYSGVKKVASSAVAAGTRGHRINCLAAQFFFFEEYNLSNPSPREPVPFLAST